VGDPSDRSRRPLFREISKSYGCKTGWSRHQLYLAAYRLNLGGLRHFEHVEWNRVTRLVFVCRGNICRSPYAEALARRLGLNATSCGLEVSGHSCVDATAVRIARQLGFELSDHQPRRCGLPLAAGDLWVGMEPWHGRHLLGFSQGSGAQVTLLGLWCSRPRPHIQDPYGLGEGYFHTCFGLMDDAVGEVARRLEAHGSECGKQ
jgi:protein-tyrosine phosphatase